MPNFKKLDHHIYHVAPALVDPLLECQGDFLLQLSLVLVRLTGWSLLAPSRFDPFGWGLLALGAVTTAR